MKETAWRGPAGQSKNAALLSLSLFKKSLRIYVFLKAQAPGAMGLYKIQLQ